jgi:hypothetical protein
MPRAWFETLAPVRRQTKIERTLNNEKFVETERAGPVVDICYTVMES